MIYVVEDDRSIRELIVYTLTSMNLKAMGFEKSSEFWKQMKKQMPTLVMLDVMLPDESGIEILKKIRKSGKTERLPVIMVTAKASEYDRVKGLDSGADDYIPKPFSMLEMVARVKALLRRTTDRGNQREYIVENLYVCPAKHIVKVDGKDVMLTLKEFELLCLLLQNKGIVLTREQLLNQIWGYEFDGESRTVDVHIRTLRQKLGDTVDVIKTIRGVGYKI